MLKKYEPVRFVTPRAFLDALDVGTSSTPLAALESRRAKVDTHYLFPYEFWLTLAALSLNASRTNWLRLGPGRSCLSCSSSWIYLERT